MRPGVILRVYCVPHLHTKPGTQPNSLPGPRSPPLLTQRAGRLLGESCRRCELWMRCLCTSSSAEGSVQK